MKKKLLSMFLAAVLAAGAAGCGQSASAGSSGGAANEFPEVTLAFVTFNNLPSNTEHVEEALNPILEEKIGAHVNLEVYSVANYQEQISLRISGGEDVGLIQTLGDLNQYVSKNMLTPMDDLLAEYGQDITEIIPEDFLNCTRVDGKQYSIPSYKGVAFAPCLVYDAEMMDSLGIDTAQIQSIEDLDAVFSAVLEQYPNVIPIAPANAGDIGALDVITDMDFLTDDMFTTKGVLLGDSTEVVSLYASDRFRELIELTRDWYEKGYISKDAATTTTLASEAISSGQAFSYIALYSGDTGASAMQLSNMIGKEVDMVRIGDPYVSTSNVSAVSWGIPVSCKNPEAAMKLLNLIYSDREVLNTILYGVEGVDHVMLDEDHIGFPEGETAQTVPYFPMNSAMLGNQFNAYLLEGQSTDNLTIMDEENRTALRSSAFGFTFDSTSVKTQYASVGNVLNQYLPGLRCGSLDPDTAIAQFNVDLEAAGINDIIAEKQAQLDAWLAQQ